MISHFDFDKSTRWCFIDRRISQTYIHTRWQIGSRLCHSLCVCEGFRRQVSGAFLSKFKTVCIFTLMILSNM
jgi:hypothetical protein